MTIYKAAVIRMGYRCFLGMPDTSKVPKKYLKTTTKPRFGAKKRGTIFVGR